MSQRAIADRSDQASPFRELLLLGTISLLVAGLTRAVVLPLSVIDWDESIYMLVGRDVLRGLLPYEGAFDHKPAALHYLFALAQLVFGGGVHAIRLLAIIVVTATALVLSWLMRTCASANFFTSASVGVIYAILSTLNGGLATNSEIILNLYLAAAFLIFYRSGMTRRFAPRAALSLGGVFGIMVHTNYLAGLWVLAFCLVYFLSVRSTLGLARGLKFFGKTGLIVLAGFLAVSAVLLAPIIIWSDITHYFVKQYDFLSGYRAYMGETLSILRITDALLKYIMILSVILFFLAYRFMTKKRGSAENRDMAYQMQVFLFFSTLAISASGRFYSHYFILLLPSLCILTGLTLNWPTEHPQGRRFFAAVAIVAAVTSIYFEPYHYSRGFKAHAEVLAGRPADFLKQIARDLKDVLDSSDTVYVYDYHHVLYALLDVEPPTKYPFSHHHLDLYYAGLLSIDPATEVARILKQGPRFVITGSDPAEGRYGDASEVLNVALARDYHVLRSYAFKDGVVRVHERISEVDSR